MVIYINLFSNVRISPNSDDKDLASIVGATESAEVRSFVGESFSKKVDARRVSDTPSDATLTNENALVVRPQWIAGVGDILGSGRHVDRSQRTNSGVSTPQLDSSSNPLKNLAKNNFNEPTDVQRFPHGRNHVRSALRRHCDFWDRDGDGIIYPWDIYVGFQRLGFHFTLCLWAAVTMAIAASYNTQASWIPHPLFAIDLNNINSNRHGSSTGTYDMDGELDERRFDAIFSKYARGKDYLTLWSTYKVWRNQRCGLDFFGWFAGGLEWIAMYILLWPEDGVMSKEDVRGVFDGTMFYAIAERHHAILYRKYGLIYSKWSESLLDLEQGSAKMRLMIGAFGLYMVAPVAT